MKNLFILILCGACLSCKAQSGAALSETAHEESAKSNQSVELLVPARKEAEVQSRAAAMLVELYSNEPKLSQHVIDDIDVVLSATTEDCLMASLLEIQGEPQEEKGGFVVDGDVYLPTVEDLADFIQGACAPLSELTQGLRPNGVGSQWPTSKKHDIKYCVSDAFKENKGSVVRSLSAAAGAWEAVADITFRHVAEQDSTCSWTTEAVDFHVIPVSGKKYLARAFLPHYARLFRSLSVESRSLLPNREPSLEAILRHELGHVLGFRHEQVRSVEASQIERCKEGGSWKPLTSYDPYSVMHYPQCAGRGGWNLEITRLDARGAQLVYGIPDNAQSFTEPPIAPSLSEATPFERDAGGESVVVLAPKEGSQLVVKATADNVFRLAVSVGDEEDVVGYVCRTELSAADKMCTVNVYDERVYRVVVSVPEKATGQLIIEHTPRE